jgi:hypothetical protein
MSKEHGSTTSVHPTHDDHPHTTTITEETDHTQTEKSTKDSTPTCALTMKKTNDESALNKNWELGTNMSNMQRPYTTDTDTTNGYRTAHRGTSAAPDA